MRKHLYVFAFIAMCLIHFQASAQTDKASELGVLLNAVRAKQGLPALTNAKQLSDAAQAHAQDMHKKRYFSHRSQNGADFFQRIERQGYEPCYASENIAQGQQTPSEAFKSWMQSQGHRLNNLSPKPTQYGVGYSGNYWVMMFARPC